MLRASSLYFACVLFLGCSYEVIAQTQQVPQSALPDSPDTVSQVVSAAYSQSQGSSSSRAFTAQQGNASPFPADAQIPQTKRILGIIPNFRAVSANEVLSPQSAKEKFITATEDSFDYSALVLPAVFSGLFDGYPRDSGVPPRSCWLWPLFLAQLGRSVERELRR
ncbi:MAG TPA: hypothetical protein VGG18_00580 [Granulicella sp.]